MLISNVYPVGYFARLNRAETPYLLTCRQRQQEQQTFLISRIQHLFVFMHLAIYIYVLVDSYLNRSIWRICVSERVFLAFNYGLAIVYSLLHIGCENRWRSSLFRLLFISYYQSYYFVSRIPHVLLSSGTNKNILQSVFIRLYC